MFFVLLIGVPCSYLAFFLIAYPCLIALRKRDQLTILNTTICGFFGGVIAFNVVMIMVSLLSGGDILELRQLYLNSVWGAFFGIVSALSWGVIAGCPMK